MERLFQTDLKPMSRNKNFTRQPKEKKKIKKEKVIFRKLLKKQTKQNASAWISNLLAWIFLTRGIYVGPSFSISQMRLKR